MLRPKLVPRLPVEPYHPCQQAEANAVLQKRDKQLFVHGVIVRGKDPIAGFNNNFLGQAAGLPGDYRTPAACPTPVSLTVFALADNLIKPIGAVAQLGAR